ncbi:dimethylarginine dimethylaminohydrolase family protein [Microbacterium sp. MPKO10]|uniref:dimethylarginine dimethylaminohydrolase family protein n=1 Tax=Microbacterium sp. MPKO10 TaxID=2989818 RepID=UPI00223636AB|nr:dimethylarginine dimethylaminohydrolase [Microbacterium sp. MPKO10]MCW4457640.1 dimethylarginine dimethylaminohydrolase [Microbacterium sp. MPKO10]
MTVTWARRVIASLASAVLVALLGHVAAVTAFFLVNQMQPTILGPASSYFILATLFTFFLLFIAGMLGAMTTWKWALPAGIVVGVIAPVVGVMLTTLQQGGAVTGEIFGLMVGTLTSTNAIFALAVFIGAPTLGRAVYAATVGYREAPRAAERRIALVRLPATALTEGDDEVETDIDSDLADKQWDAYTAAFEENGWSTREVAFASELPDSVFVQDGVVLLDDLAIITRPADETRRRELDGIEETIDDLGFTIERIMDPGTFEGGDALLVGDTLYVGRTERTNAEGLRQLRSIVAPYGFSVVAAPMSRVHHLKAAITALPDGTFIGDPSSIDEPTLFPGFIAAPEPAGAAVVVLNDDTVLLAASAPKTADLLDDLGYNVVVADISEFEKLGGSITCLSVRVR